MKPLIYCFVAVFCQAALSAPMFSLHNKSLKGIEAVVMEQGQNGQRLSVAAGQFADIQELDTTKKINVTISQDEQILYVANILPHTFKDEEPQTIYINWNPVRTPPLYPQRGPYLGATGKTDLGYSTENNVVLSNIKPEPECIKIKTDFGTTRSSFHKASLQYHPDKCASEECKSKFLLLFRCYSLK